MTRNQAETETLNNHNPSQNSDSGHNLINSASDASETSPHVFQKSSMAFTNGSEEEVIKIEDDHDPGNILDSSRNSNNQNNNNNDIENNKTPILRKDYSQSSSLNSNSSKQFHPKRLLGLFPAIFF